MTDLNHIFPFNSHEPEGPNPHKTTGQVRHLDKRVSDAERELYNNWWQEQINQFGTEIDYFPSGYTLSGHDFIYGEQPDSKYDAPIKMVMALELNESAIVLNKFGLVGDDEITGYLSIDTFWRTMSSEEQPRPEPKSGDVFKLTEYGSRDRVAGRDGKVFEITDRVDQDISKINPLLGHYIWLVRAKRFDYSFEPGLQPEGGMNQVFDDTHSGLLSGYNQSPSVEKTYSQNTTTQSKIVFDYDEYNESNDDIYGGYG